MHAVNLISSALSPEDAPIPEGGDPGICCITGQPCATVPRKSLLGPSFTDGQLLQAPGSDRIGVDACRALSYKWERMSSWLCDARGFHRLDRQGVRQAVLQPHASGAWCGYATTSYKKHGSLRTPVNGPGRAVWLHEMRLVDCGDTARVQAIWQRLNEAIRNGIPRPVIESLDASPYCIRDAGINRWMAFEVWARPLLTTSLYQFLAYLLPSQEELKTEGHRREKPNDKSASVARPAPPQEQQPQLF